MTIQENLERMNGLITQGQIIEAVDQFFADDIISNDVGAESVIGKAPKREGLEGFVNSIAAVNEITNHNNAIHGDTSYSEYTFKFDLADGTVIDWYEVIARKWDGDKVVRETYFQN